MATKKSAKSYSVKFCIRAIVEVDLSANSLEDALAMADGMVDNDKFFRDEFAYIDGHISVAGLDDMTEWDSVNE